MAKIPLASFNQNIPGDISSIDTSVMNRGTDFAALERQASQVADIGQSLLEKRYKAETSNAVFNASLDQKLKMSEFENQERLNNPTGKDYQKNILENGQKIFEQQLETMPNNDAKQMYMQDGQEILGKASMEAGIYENKALADTYKGDFENRINMLARKHDINPKPLDFESDVASAEADIKANAGINLPASQQDEYLKFAKSNIAEGILSGLYAKKNYNEALGLLKKDQNIASSLEPKAYERWVEKLSNKITYENEISKAQLNQTKTDFDAFVLNGGVPDQNRMTQLLSDAKRRLKPGEYAIFSDQIKSTITAGAEMYKLHNLTNQEISSYQSPQLVNGVFDAKNRIELEAKINKTKEDIITARQKDINAYTMKQNPEIANLQAQTNNLTDPVLTPQLLDARELRAKSYGAQYEVLSKSEASTIESLFNSAPSGAAAAKIVEGYQTSMGDKAAGAFSQIFKDKAHAPFMLMGYMPDLQDKIQAYDSIKSYDSNKKLLRPDTVKSIEDEARNKVAPWLAAISGASSSGMNSSVANSMKQLVQMDAIRLRATGTSDRDAVKQSFNNIISKNFVYAQVGNSAVVVPRESARDPLPVVNSEANLTRFLNFYSNKDNLKGLDIQPDPEYFTKGSNPNDVEQRYINTLNEIGQWVPNKSQSGLQLVIDDPAHGMRPVYNKKGELIQKSFREINLMPIGRGG